MATPPQVDWIERTWPVMEALDRHERELTTESGEALSAAIAEMYPSGGIVVALAWAQMLAEVAADGADAVIHDAPMFRRDLAVELVQSAYADKSVQVEVLNRVLDLDDAALHRFLLCLADATRCHVIGPCGGLRHFVPVLAACEQAGSSHVDLQPAVVSCAITLAANSRGNHTVGMHAAEIGLSRCGFAAVMTVMWLVSRAASRGRRMRGLLTEEHGIPETIIDGSGSESGGDHRPHTLCVRLLRTGPDDPALPGLFDEIRALSFDDQMVLLWSTATAVGSLVAPPPTT